MGYVVPFDRRAADGRPRSAAARKRGASPGDMVVVEITRWPTATPGRDRPRHRGARRHRRAGRRHRDHHPQVRHSRRALRRRRRRGRAPRRRGRATRTSTAAPTSATCPTVTIDGEHARDFDDAITIEQLPNGHYWLGVHIADVSHYVQEGSALDREAYERGTSVYFPERAVHMFPLGAGDRAVQPQSARRSARAVVPDGGRSRSGEVVRYEMHDGVINSDERMTYTAVNGILTDRDPGAARAVRAARADVRADARAVPHPQRRAGAGAARSTSTCTKPRSSSTRAAWSRRSSRCSATSRIA